MESITQLAEQFGVSTDLLQQYTDYIIRKAKEHPEAFAADPAAFVDKAVKHYSEKAVAYYREALDNPDKFSQLLADVQAQLT